MDRLKKQAEFDRLMDKMETQSAEFDALSALAEEFDKLCSVPIVDDHYPEARHYFEGKLADFLAAMKANGRFDHPGNRYGLSTTAPPPDKQAVELLCIVDEETQRCRDAIDKCASWSPAQAEWARARDACLNIRERIDEYLQEQG